MVGRPIRISVPPPRGQWRALLASLLLVAIVGALGAWASIDARSFYVPLVKPAWAPPPGIFAPVWSTLYVFMAVAAWLIWRAKGGVSRAADALAIYCAQLVLNALWSWLFFRWHQGALALLEVCLLWLVILGTLVHFWRIRQLAGLLLLPYLVWVAFATALTAAVWRLNPGIL